MECLFLELNQGLKNTSFNSLQFNVPLFHVKQTKCYDHRPI